MDSNITNRQIVLILFLTITSNSVVDISKTIVTHAGYDGWITLLITGIIFSIFTVIILKLQSFFYGKTIMEYSEDLLGKTAKYAITTYYLLYFSIISVYLTINLSITLRGNFLIKTPPIALIIYSLPIFCFIAYKGINTVARLFELWGVVYIMMSIALILMLIAQGNFRRILPLFMKSDFPLCLKAIKETIFNFLGIELLLYIPLNKQNGKKIIKAGSITIFLVGVFYVLVVQSCIMKLGMDDIVHYKSSFIVAIRDMEFPMLDFFKRIDILFLTAGFSAFALSISTIITIMINILCKLFKNVHRRVVTIVFGSILFIFCSIFLSISWFIPFVLQSSIYLGLFACAGFPIILLIITKVKNKCQING